MKFPATSDIRDSAIRLTIGAQGILLIAACFAFIYQFFLLPQFPEDGIFGEKGALYLVYMIPNALLLTITFLDKRWSPFIGLVLTLVVVISYVTIIEPLPFLRRSEILLWTYSLVCLAVATFAARKHAAEALQTLFAPCRYRPVQILLVFATPVVCFYGFALLFMSAVLSDLGDQNPSAYAPNTSYAARRAWGQNEMREYFKHVDRWIRKSELITSDVGKVTGVAPIGWPNKVVTFFTDGPNVSMNLQVIGERGEGVLTLPQVNISGYIKKDIKQPFGIHIESSWNFLDSSTAITSTGKSWIQEKGFGEAHERILNAATDGNQQRVIKACQALERTLPKSFGDEDRKRWGPELHCGMFLGLPPQDRRSLLLLLGDSHAAVGNVAYACDCYFDAAGISFYSIENAYWSGSNWTPTNPAVLVDELDKANQALKKAHQLAPENETLKKLARQRAMLAYQQRNGHLLDSTWNLSDDQLRERNKADLRDLYKIAKKLAKKSPWLRQELGQMKIRPIKYSGSQIKINESDRYQAHVTVEIAGSNGTHGKFSLNVIETPELSPPIDLYASAPRYPTRNYRGNSLTWRPEEGKRVRLHGRTFMPIKRK